MQVLINTHGRSWVQPFSGYMAMIRFFAQLAGESGYNVEEQ